VREGDRGYNDFRYSAKVGDSHSVSRAWRKPCKSTLREIFREHNFIKFADMPCGGCECVAEGGCMQGCCVGGMIDARSRPRRCMESVTVRTKSTRVGHTARQSRCRHREPILRGEAPPQWSWPMKEDTGDVVAEGRRFGYGEGGMVRAQPPTQF